MRERKQGREQGRATERGARVETGSCLRSCGLPLTCIQQAGVSTACEEAEIAPLCSLSKCWQQNDSCPHNQSHTKSECSLSLSMQTVSQLVGICYHSKLMQV